LPKRKHRDPSSAPDLGRYRTAFLRGFKLRQFQLEHDLSARQVEELERLKMIEYWDTLEGPFWDWHEGMDRKQTLLALAAHERLMGE
jgi:hypothetical protein